MDRRVAAARVADRPRRAGIAGRRRERVVGALAVRQADRVDRRQVEDVEAELGELGDDLLRRPRSRPRSAGRARTRRRSAPARGRRRRASVRVHRRRAAAVGVALDGREAARGRARPRGSASSSRRLRERALDALAVGALRARAGGLLEQHHALRQLAGEVLLAGVDLAPQLLAPGGERVGPGLDRPRVAAEPVDGRTSPAQRSPAIVRVDARASGSRPTCCEPGAQERTTARSDVVAVGEDVGADRDGVADGALGRVAAAVDHRRRAARSGCAAAAVWRVFGRGHSLTLSPFRGGS